jgi:hypothetical protein
LQTFAINGPVTGMTAAVNAPDTNGLSSFNTNFLSNTFGLFYTSMYILAH